SGELSMGQIRAEVRAGSGETGLSLGAIRKLAGKPSGAISYSDLRGKKCPTTGEVRHTSQYGNGGSGGGWSNWTGWITTADFGFFDNVKVNVLCECIDGNYDEIGIRVQVSNVNNPNVVIARQGNWGSGDNWTSSQSATWALSADELSRLGGSLSCIQVRYQMMINRGSRGAINRSTVKLITS
ncbi:MAG: hypothetical protein ACRDBG_11325, partial [Waterburya sp.]